MQVIGYVRVSTEEQAKEGVSLDAQKARIIEWCEQHGHQLLAVYEDAGISGCSMARRPGIQAALAHVYKLKDGIFVVWNLSRLARDNYDAAAIHRMLDRKRVKLESLSEHIDPSTPEGELQYAVLSSVNTLYRKQIGKFTKAALWQLRVEGKRYTRIIPFGYALGPDGQSLVRNETEYAVIELTQTLRTERRSLRRLRLS